MRSLVLVLFCFLAYAFCCIWLIEVGPNKERIRS